MQLEWGASSQTMKGQQECGDAWLVEGRGGGWLAAVVDGLGHGHEARVAADAAVACLREGARPDLEALLRETHAALARTRGAALSLAWLEEDSLRWSGVGNVEGLVMRRGADPRAGGERLLLHPGILGSNFGSTRVALLPFLPGDSLALATDGLRPEFARHFPQELGAASGAERLLELFAHGMDDALVLCVRRIS